MTLMRKIIRSGNGHKAACPGDDHIVRAAGAVDHQQISVLIPSTNDANMRIIRVKYQVTGPGVLPAYVGAIAVLGGSSTAMPNHITSARLVVKYPIHESTAIHPVGAIASRGGAARRRDLQRLDSSFPNGRPDGRFRLRRRGAARPAANVDPRQRRRIESEGSHR